MIFKDQLVDSTNRISDGTNPCDSVTIHDTGNTQVGANAQMHANLQSRGNDREASWHEQLDDTQAIRSYLPESQCWHAGDGNGPGNTTSYAIELCVNADGDLVKAVSNLVRLVIKRLDEFNLTTDDIVDHNHWSGKHCPRTFRDNPGSWDRFIQAVKDRDPDANILQGDTMSKFSSPVPVGCRFTSGFGTRWGVLHAGADWAPPKPGQTGIPVFAVHSGTVIATGTGTGSASSRIPYHSGRYVWLDIGVHGGDRMRIYYGHLASVSVKSGQKVKAGQQIGVMGATGNVTGVHLHLGVSVNHNRPTVAWTARTNTGWTDPARWLRSKGITPGKTSPAVSTSVTTAKATKPKTSSSSGVSTLQLQKDFNRYAKAGLIEDGKHGSVTNSWVQWTKQIQRALPAWRGIDDLTDDGHYGRVTSNAVATLQRRNGLHPDGVMGPVTIKFMRDNGSHINNRPRNRP